MKISRFFDYSNGIFATAFVPIQKSLDAYAANLYKKSSEFSPWLIRSGKGDVNHPQYENISIYRHCMDVAIVSSYILFYAWQNGKLTIDKDDADSAIALFKENFLVAFCHDADKVLGAKSSSPTLEQVTTVYKMLQADTWSTLSIEAVYHLVSCVEARGLSGAMFVPVSVKSLSPDIKILGHVVGHADQIASAATLNGYQNTVDVFNKKNATILSDLYGTPRIPLKLYTIRNTPIVIYEFQKILVDMMYTRGIFPLVCLAEGETLCFSLPEDFDVSIFVTAFEEQLSEGHPDIKRKSTTGDINVYSITSYEDVVSLVANRPDMNLLCIHRNFLGETTSYLKGWVTNFPEISFKVPDDKIIISVMQNKSDTESSLPKRVLWAMEIIIALRANTDTKLFNGRVEALFKLYPQLSTFISTQFTKSVEEFDKNTLQTILATQIAITVESNDDIEKIVNDIFIKGLDEQSSEVAPGVKMICDKIKEQLGCLSEITDNQDCTDGDKKCLLCGKPSDVAIDSSLRLVGIKKSAFSNRIGHYKSITSESGQNYLCDGCIKSQELLSNMFFLGGKKTKAGMMIVSIPFHSVIKPAGVVDGKKTCINTFNTACGKFTDFASLLPWNQDLSNQYPFFIEETPVGLKKTIDCIHRAVLFAIKTGNPVHMFTSVQRPVPEAFLCDWMPSSISTLLGGTAFRREELPSLLDKLWMIKKIICDEGTLKKSNGFEILAAMSEFGWWAVAWAVIKGEKKDDSAEFTVLDAKKMLEISRKEFPMTKDECLERLAKAGVAIQDLPLSGDGRNTAAMAFDTAIEVYDNGMELGFGDVGIPAAIADVLQEHLERRHKTPEYVKHGSYEEFSSAFVEIMRFMPAVYGSDGFRKFVRAAYMKLFQEYSWQRINERSAIKKAEAEAKKNKTADTAVTSEA